MPRSYKYSVTLTNSKEAKYAEVTRTTRRSGLSKEELIKLLLACHLDRIDWGDAVELAGEYDEQNKAIQADKAIDDREGLLV